MAKEPNGKKSGAANNGSEDAAQITPLDPIYGTVKELSDLVHDLHRAEIVEVVGQDGQNKTQILVLPKGRTASGVRDFLDEYRLAPERRCGTAHHVDLPSFIEHVNRFKDGDSALFAKPADGGATQNPTVVGVINYHRIGHDGAPQFGDHRSIYTCPLSKEWRAWKAKDGEKMNQRDFAEFIEDRIADAMPTPVADANGEFSADERRLMELSALLGGVFASPSKLMEIARGMKLTVDERVTQAVNISSGEVSISYDTSHADAGGNKLTVPNLFLIAIPVFELGSLYRIAVRLRYRIHQGTIAWFYQLYRAEKVFDHAFTEVCDMARSGTQLPLFVGTPEA